MPEQMAQVQRIMEEGDISRHVLEEASGAISPNVQSEAASATASYLGQDVAKQQEAKKRNEELAMESEQNEDRDSNVAEYIELEYSAQGLLHVENDGMNKPDSMSSEEVAQQMANAEHEAKDIQEKNQ